MTPPQPKTPTIEQEDVTPSPPRPETERLARGLRATTVHGATEGATDGASAAAEVASTAAEHLAGWQRARADYENLLRRTEQDHARATEAAKDQLLADILPLADYFSAATRHIPDALKSNAWTEGVLRIQQVFEGFVRDHDVTTVDAVGVPLDPKQHEAVAEVPSDSDAGTVVEVVTPGYVRNGRVLRPAKVKISRGRPTV